MRILILNSGSSSIKFQLIRMPSEKVLSSGMVERIGMEDAILTYRSEKIDLRDVLPIQSHRKGLDTIAGLLLDEETGVIETPDQLDAVGHRVVHGGGAFADTTLIDATVRTKIEEFSSLAPLHNPHNLEGIRVAEQLFPKAAQVAVFDTAFHRSMPPKAHRYAIPNALYTDHGIQAYGFHGTSHKYVSEKAIAYLRQETSKIITIHLGNGCSMTAVLNGKSVDHSLGFAPSNGLIMGSRSGDIDHAIIFHMINGLGYTLGEVDSLLTKKSGLLGLTGFSDLRDIEAKAKDGDMACRLAIDMVAYRIQKYIGAYTAAMNGLDALVFTAGIGENSNLIRERVCSEMDYLGMELDMVKNAARADGLREIGAASSPVRILVIPTNEELEIAQQAYSLCNKGHH